MAYIGKSPIIGNFVKLDAITAVNGQAAYTMQNGGSNFTDYESVNQFLVSLNGTIQAPTDSFTVSGSTLTFASNLSTGDVIDFIMVFGNSLSAGTPTDSTVTKAKLADQIDIFSGTSLNAADLGSGIHIKTADSGASVSANADELILEGSGNTGITIASGNTGGGNIFFADDGGVQQGKIQYDHDSNAMLFRANNTDILKIYSNGVAAFNNGIALGVGTANTASNVLDDYEEGSHTVTTNSGLTLSLNDFKYTKIGNFVILSGKATVNTTDGSSTQVTMSLPFASSDRNAVTVNFVSGQNTGDIGLVAYSNNSSNIQFYNVNDNGNESNHTNADLSGGDEYYFTFTYRSV